MIEILVRELRDEHRDREWVDAYGNHWAWCEDTWVWRLPPEEARAYPPNYPGVHEWIPCPYDVVNKPRRGYEYGPGPFMEALHHRAIYSKVWS